MPGRRCGAGDNRLFADAGAKTLSAKPRRHSNFATAAPGPTFGLGVYIPFQRTIREAERRGGGAGDGRARTP